MTVRVAATGASTAVLGSNTTRVQVTVNEETARPTAASAIDNPARGTAGHAVHSMSVTFGLPEGLDLDLSTNGVAQ
ncbi:hypothetical protein [Streptomyces sp. H27-C3]|uniref:hypothetical protein n=1 Tax=Streptomyces sp. H27-C3 TaxID=3046305 RepID=UPI0024BB6932|nr:hypothetical protein [Streptomyces sp. H27-C3]MDJ0463942.1 hypothetical protein [Streptomyces sp. H27-C3]